MGWKFVPATSALDVFNPRRRASPSSSLESVPAQALSQRPRNAADIQFYGGGVHPVPGHTPRPTTSRAATCPRRSRASTAERIDRTVTVPEVGDPGRLFGMSPEPLRPQITSAACRPRSPRIAERRLDQRRRSTAGRTSAGLPDDGERRAAIQAAPGAPAVAGCSPSSCAPARRPLTGGRAIFPLADARRLRRRSRARRRRPRAGPPPDAAGGPRTCRRCTAWSTLALKREPAAWSGGGGQAGAPWHGTRAWTRWADLRGRWCAPRSSAASTSPGVYFPAVATAPSRTSA